MENQSDRCDCCLREKGIVGVYANPFMPVSEGYCQECESVGATPIWSIPFGYFRNIFGFEEYNFESHVLFSRKTNQYISAKTALDECLFLYKDGAIKDRETLQLALYKYLGFINEQQ
jgi:hypothetical protein